MRICVCLALSQPVKLLSTFFLNKCFTLPLHLAYAVFQLKCFITYKLSLRPTVNSCVKLAYAPRRSPSLVMTCAESHTLHRKTSTGAPQTPHLLDCAPPSPEHLGTGAA